MKQAILVVSFGTSYNESRKKTIEAIEKTLQETFRDYDFYRAFTSRIIIKKLKERDNLSIDGVSEALEKLVLKGYRRVIIQPTLVMGGEEYDRILSVVEQYNHRFDKIEMGMPLLTDEKDYLSLVSILIEDTKEYMEVGTEILFMGHGTEHEANRTYSHLADVLKTKGYLNCHVGTVEAVPTFEMVKQEIDKKVSKQVILQPLMVVSGDHAHNDMAGKDADSWKSQLEKDGYEVTCRLKGMGELEGVREMFLLHAQRAKKNMEEIQ
ncbi:sirohydrochlorin cobaltochelatase [Clostridium sp. E02]|uniref:sirohydrochlorin cobaltochelatase n=1 Tax=Clostridium sp. E02 TaxID=2487134 RepID=UPI000F523254|nr:sirohydrochlorin cobaltochelatase [Clostridium sp. E02]